MDILQEENLDCNILVRAYQGAVSPIVNLAIVAEFPIAELPVTTITRLHYTHITAADNALVSILD